MTERPLRPALVERPLARIQPRICVGWTNRGDFVSTPIGRDDSHLCGSVIIAVTATLWSGMCRVLPIRENGILLDLLFRADAWMEPPTGLPLVTVVVAVCHRLLQIRS